MWGETGGSNTAQNVFASLSKPLQRALRERGFPSPTKPQESAIPLIMSGKNVLLIAPTGTGKTEAAFLPVLDALLVMPDRPKGIKALYITPLRALNRDMLDRLQWWCKTLDIRLAVRHGDTETSERSRQTLAPPDVMITTPETLQAILPGRVLRNHLRDVQWVIVDEVHELAGEKRGSQLSIALERLRLLTQREFQLIGLSATIGTPDRVARFLVGVGRDCEVVEVSVARTMELEVVYPKASKADMELAQRIYTHPEAAARINLIKNLLDSHKSSLIFTNTRTEAESLANRFRLVDLNYPLGIHHGSLAKTTRVAAERGLKEGKLTSIICTSSLELGIDIGQLDLVIQYNSPREVTRLIQRVGRSGHSVGAIAKGIIVAQDSDEALEAAVISRRALAGLLEPVEIPERPYDTLTHQLVGLLLHKSRWYREEAIDLCSKAYPYRDLDVSEMNKVLRYMHERYPRLAWFSERDQILARPQRTPSFFDYYFKNLSMIPDEKQFLVVEEDGASVGVLDEAFVAEHGEIGTKFVEGGQVWSIKQVYGDKIFVRKESDPVGAIPTWVGEEIPVPFEIAMEVGYLRGIAEGMLKQGLSLDQAAGTLSHDYPGSIATFSRAIHEVAEHVERSIPTPTDQRILIEQWRGYTVFSCSFGHMVNRTLARLIGHALSEKVGAPMAVQQDPYRIILNSTEFPLKDLSDLLKSLGGKDLEEEMKVAIEKTGLFRRRFLHVAKKFGAVEKDAELSSSRLSDLIAIFKETAIFEEALRTALLKDADIVGTKKVLREISEGKIEVVLLDSGDDLSPVAKIGIDEIGRRGDLVPPERMRKILLQSARARLLNESRTLVCTNCWEYVENRRIASIGSLVCPTCGSNRLGVVDDEEEMVWRVSDVAKEGAVGKRFRRTYSKILKTADVIEKHGMTAVLALAGRRISASDAASIASAESEVNEKLIELIMDAEKKNLRRRYFVTGS